MSDNVSPSGIITGDAHSFEPFARHPLYHRLNENLVRKVVQQGQSRFVDLACGSGLISRLLDKVLQSQPQAAQGGPVGQRLLLGLDLSRQALRGFLKEAESLGVNLVQGAAEHIPVKSGSFDALVFGNAIHMIRDKVGVVAEIARVLRKDGLFAFNTTFFEGAYPEETFSFYRAWIFKAMRVVKRYPDVQIKKSGKVEAMNWLTPEAYRELVEAHGFAVVDMTLEEAHLTLESLKDISDFSDFAEGALPGVPLEIAAEVLKVTAEETFREQNRSYLPRNWLQVVCQRI